MADKTIPQLPAISSLVTGVKFPVDDGFQTWSADVSQVRDYVSDYLYGRLGDINNDAVVIPARDLGILRRQFGFYAPTITRYTTGSGTHALTYLFFIDSGSATVGATYTHNSVTYTVAATIASEMILKARGSAVPFASGVLTKASGTGDATLTFHAFRAPLILFGEMVGGGGGAGGDNVTSNIASGVAGGSTTFGTATAPGGGAGNSANPSGNGTPTAPNYTIVTINRGQIAQSGGRQTTGVPFLSPSGGVGGASMLGGGGPGNGGGAGVAALSAGGGGGGGSAAAVANRWAGSGGNGATGIKFAIENPTGTFAYGIGAGGAGGNGATNNGGAGFLGLICLEERYQ